MRGGAEAAAIEYIGTGNTMEYCTVLYCTVLVAPASFTKYGIPYCP